MTFLSQRLHIYTFCMQWSYSQWAWPSLRMEKKIVSLASVRWLDQSWYMSENSIPIKVQETPVTTWPFCFPVRWLPLWRSSQDPEGCGDMFVCQTSLLINSRGSLLLLLCFVSFGNVVRWLCLSWWRRQRFHRRTTAILSEDSSLSLIVYLVFVIIVIQLPTWQ